MVLLAVLPAVLSAAAPAGALPQPTVTLLSSQRNATVRQTVTFTATVAAPAGGTAVPTGVVTFGRGYATYCASVPLSGGRATCTTALPAGPQAVYATYYGDATYSDGYASAAVEVQGDPVTVSMSSSPNPSVSWQTITFVARVSRVAPDAPEPTGTVSFDLDNAACRDVPLVGGEATCAFGRPVANQPVVAIYRGDAWFVGGRSPVSTLATGQAATRVVLLSRANPSPGGQSVTVTAFVEVLAPGRSSYVTGTVTFDLGTLAATRCTDVPLSGLYLGAPGADCILDAPPGTYPIRATYNGDTELSGSVSQVLVQTVAAGLPRAAAGAAAPAGQELAPRATLASPTVTLVSSSNPKELDVPLTLTATVSRGPAGGEPPSGTVEFKEGATVLCRELLPSGGNVTCAPDLPIGSHDLTATYGGDATFAGATSPVLTQVVTRSTTRMYASTTPNPSAAGQPVRLFVNSNPWGPPWTGIVTFLDDGVPVCTGLPASNDGTSCVVPLPTGHHAITASYSGDAIRTPGASEPVIQSVGLATATVGLTTSTTSTTPAGPVALTATVAPVVAAAGLPTGSVTFRDGDRAVCADVPVLLGRAGCVALLGAGNHPLRAVYSGSSTLGLAVSPSVNVVGAGEPVAVAVTSSASPVVWGQSVTLGATVAAPVGVPTGSVSFYAGIVPVCADVPLSDGRASCESKLRAGTMAITAVYGGDPRFEGGTSPTLAQTVLQASTSILMTPVASPVRAAFVPLTATVSIDQPGAGTPTGSVWFQEGAAPVCTAFQASPGVWQCHAELSVGPHRLTAVYTGSLQEVGSTSAPIDVTVLPEGDELVPVTPSRLLDTRAGIGGPATPIGPGAARDVTVRGGTTGIPESASAVVLNTTVTQATASSYLTVWPAGSPWPGTSNLNFSAGQTIPNLVTVAVGTGGRVSLINAAGSVHALLDVVGYYTTAGGGSTFTAVTPSRLLDTRTGAGGPAVAIGAGATRDLIVRSGSTGVPAAATAVVLNTTAVAPTAASYLTVFPAGGGRPVASNLNFVTGQTIPNLVVVGVGAGDRISIFNSAGSVHVVADVVGYFAPGRGSRFTAIPPTRAYDSRLVNGPSGSPVGPGATRPVAVRGFGAIPGYATAVVVNLTVALATDTSYLTVSPSGTARPLASNLNFSTGQVIPNLVMVGVGPNSGIDIYNAAGRVHVVVDIVGFMS